LDNFSDKPERRDTHQVQMTQYWVLQVRQFLFISYVQD
jgi:hypothetical protein